MATLYYSLTSVTGAAWSWWASVPSDVQAGVITAVASIAAAAVGFLAVIIQIGRQARLAVDQARLSAATKLKLELYERVLATCAEASDQARHYQSFVAQAVSDVEIWVRTNRLPSVRTLQHMKLENEAHESAVGVVTTVESWLIVDPRMRVFQSAMGSALHDFRLASRQLFSHLLKILPMDAPDGTPIPYPLPTPEALAALRATSEAVTEAVSVLGCYIGDFRDAMQQALLKDLFPNRVPVRAPIDPRYFAITLDRADELRHHFETETAWGRAMNEAEAAALGGLVARASKPTQ